VYSPLFNRSRNVAYCANHDYHACNWLVDASVGGLCQACNLNRTIPDLSKPENLGRWQLIEAAKHRVVYSLLRLGLPVISKAEDPDRGLIFDFLEPVDAPDGKGVGHVLTGHDDGVITLNVVEADDATRAKIREEMGEPYRTLLGHFRHETAHYYWQLLVPGSQNYRVFRDTFGDETRDYAQALQVYYKNGPVADWQQHHISAYASSHPHEDWAETFAHYLHMVDTLETAYAFGLRIRPRAGHDENLSTAVSFDPYASAEFDPILEAWLPVTFAVNSLNRSMGVPDLYPFVIAPEVVNKLRVLHNILHSVNRGGSTFNKVRAVLGRALAL
jgi:hypothetical protein